MVDDIIVEKVADPTIKHVDKDSGTMMGKDELRLAWLGCKQGRKQPERMSSNPLTPM
jgi:hypothetical protein